MNGAISGSLSCFGRSQWDLFKKYKKFILAFVDSLFVPELRVCEQTELPRRRDDIRNSARVQNRKEKEIERMYVNDSESQSKASRNGNRPTNNCVDYAHPSSLSHLDLFLVYCLVLSMPMGTAIAPGVVAR